MSDSPHEEAHTGPIKTPQQLLLAVFFSFVIPVFAIIALVAYVVAENKPAGSPQPEHSALGGVNAQDVGKAVAERIRKVGTVEIRDANRPLKSGEDVFKAQCTSCHTTGAAGAPKLGDAAAWTARLPSGLDALIAASLKGKGAMPPQSGGDFDDVEIARAVVFLANAAGATFAEPQRAAASTQPAAATSTAAVSPAASAAAPTAVPVAPPAITKATTPTAAPVAPPTTAKATPTTPATPAAVPVPVSPSATAKPAAATTPAALAAAAATSVPGEALYKQACAVCHVAGVANAPKFGDKAAWAPRLQAGLPALVRTVMAGKGAMPPKGGSGASESEIQAAVEYMVNAVK